MAREHNFEGNFEFELEEDYTDETTASPFERVGSKSIAMMLAHPEALATSYSTKDAPMPGTRLQRYLRTLWFNRFTAFYTLMLDKR